MVYFFFCYRSLRHALLTSLALVLLSVLFVSPIQAQDQAAITIEVQAGYDGSYRVSHWFPVVVTVGNDGADMQGVIEWQWPDGTGSVYQQVVDLPRGARKQLNFAVTVDAVPRSAELILRDAQNEAIARTRVRLEPLDVGQFTVGVLSSDRSLLNSLVGMQFDNPNVSGVTVLHLDPALLPENSLALSGLEAIFLHDIASAELSPAQLAAIEDWVRAGGQLVVSGGAAAERSVPGVAALLPVDVGSLQQGESLLALGELAPEADTAALAATATLSTVSVRPGARTLADDNLLVTRTLGDGQVVFSAFDVGSLRAWVGEAVLWQTVIEPLNRMEIGASYRWRGDNLLRNALQLPALQLPSLWVILLLILAYIVIIGPINFLVLRRLRRVELAWISTPLLVLLFMLGTYGASFLMRGTQAQLVQIALVQSAEGASRSKTTAFVGLFSPQRRSYVLGFEPRALISAGQFDGFGRAAVTFRTSDSVSEVRDVLVDVSALRTFIVEQPEGSALSISSDLNRQGRLVSGTVRNASDRLLSDALLVSGNAALRLGDLAPGASVEARLNLNEGNFPNDFSNALVSSEGIINRQTVLNNLFDFDRFSFGGPLFQGEQGLPDPDGVYLIGWSDDLPVRGQLDTGAASQEGATMYLIRLDI
jgi:uncharacterized membrane protein YhaH (DUF805 family)